jgi:hypothetical protein
MPVLVQMAKSKTAPSAKSRSRQDRAVKTKNEEERFDTLVAKYTQNLTGTGRWFD